MRFVGAVTSVLLASTACAASTSRYFNRQFSNSTGYQLQKGPLDTDWTSKVGTNPWPEYPRPRLARSNWKNLNGVWQYQNASAGEVASPPINRTLSESILVPFCIESALSGTVPLSPVPVSKLTISGIMRKWAIYSWYRTTFEVPSDWDASNRVYLNFGAVDYETTVWVNGKNATYHRGGYWEFGVDVTDYLHANGPNELIVWVYDPTDTGDNQIPLGKQSLAQDHIFYTPCSGIWQTVWLESAPADYISQLDISADMNGKVNVTVLNGGNSSVPVEVTVHKKDSTDVKATGKGTSGSTFQFTVDSPDLWSPDDPNLYNLTIKLGSDIVQSYTGFRTIEKGRVDGVLRFILNGEPIFPFGTLDQGFWPDGIYLAPTYEALTYDIKILKDIGYNMLRKHIKAEPPLFYYAADTMGLLLIQDMPSLRTRVPKPGDTCGDTIPVRDAAVQAEFDRQLEILIQQHRNYPSIFAWVIYNEGWGQPDQPPWADVRLTDVVRSLDPTRLIDSVTGWYDHGAGDFQDNHHYAQPQCGTPFYSINSSPFNPDEDRIGFQGEFGGNGNNVSIDHLWNDPWPLDHINQTYELDKDIETWNYRAHYILSELIDQVDRFACSGAVWTQTTDVEGEVNGMMTYDRRIIRAQYDQWNDDIDKLQDTFKGRTEKESSRMMPRADGWMGME
ncbi:glycoside hydrolase superfamily [Lophiotrema nucula]|uniref:Glycoside hydrolase superfamily n=1 Tax=Lophiotrema nucula TaxID=690887 RepID=A0A6A5ZKE5_9PLEO|nr:glycoside hydrolase superfamily [Lophiotrema nucula]